MRRLVLSTAWRSSPQKSGAAILDEVLRVVHERPIDGLVLDAGWSAEALQQVRPIFARRELVVLALRGPIGRAMPTTGARDGCAPDAEVPEAAEVPASPRAALPKRSGGGRHAWFAKTVEPRPVEEPAAPRRPDASRPPRLAAPDVDERDAAIAVFGHTLELANEHGAALCTWGLGATDPEALPPLTWLGPWTRAITEDEQRTLDRANRGAQVLRRPCFDGARYALDRLLRRAERLGVTIAIENAPVPLALPNAEELHRLFAEFAGAPLAYAHDIAAARLCMSLGGPPGKELLDAAGLARLRLLYVADAGGRAAWLPLGKGTLPIAGFLGATGDVPVVLAPRADWTRADVDEGIERLRDAMTTAPAQSR